jgi:hypothetical protein
MPRDKSIVALLSVALFAVGLCAQTPASWQSSSSAAAVRHGDVSDGLQSPVAADRLVQIARELMQLKDPDQPAIDQAAVLLIAAKWLNPQARTVEPLLLTVATQSTARDYSDQILAALQSYVDERADRAIVAEAIQYLLTRRTSQDAREKLLEDLVMRIGNKNAAVDSELATALGLILQQRGDAQRARFYFLQAYNSNKYNAKAFAKLAEVAPSEIGPAPYLEHLRLAFREKPLDIEAVRNFAMYAGRLGLHEVAAEAHRYSAELFRYLYPSELLPPEIYLPWATACYNTEGGQSLCLQIAESVRRQGQFDILLEAIAGRAAARMGNEQEARRLFAWIEETTNRILSSAPGQPSGVVLARPLTARDLAWFYCFADSNPVKALDWANKSYSAEPDSPAAGALLAYALSMNGQLEWARPLLESREGNQIADIVYAQIQLVEQDRAGAVSTLQAAITKDPGSLVAERARQMLEAMGARYIPPVDPAAMTAYLRQNLGRPLVPSFLPPASRIEAQFSVHGGEFPYGTPIEATVAIVNSGLEPLVITENSLFTGRIRVDARIGGDIQRQIPSLLSQTIRTALTVQPGRSLSTQIRLSCGSLQRILQEHPQANLDIEFTLYIDPVVTPEGSVRSGIAGLEPVTVAIRRPKIDVTTTYVRTRMDSLPSGLEAQKIRTSQLFTGLLNEQHIMAQQGTLYPYRYAAWLPNLLRSALTTESGLLLSPSEGDWVVKVNAMADLLSMPFDAELTAAVGRNLNARQWPVRLMAVYLLGTTQGEEFTSVLNGMARSDPSDLVRVMAAAMEEARRPKVSLGSGWSPGLPAPLY